MHLDLGKAQERLNDLLAGTKIVGSHFVLPKVHLLHWRFLEGLFLGEFLKLLNPLIELLNSISLLEHTH